MFNIGMPELIVIFLVVLLFFGGGRLVDIAKGLGVAIREFKQSVKEEDKPDSSQKNPPDALSK